MKWPDTYERITETNEWVSRPSTTNILAAAREKQRLLNAYPDSKISIRKISANNNSNNHYYFVYIEFTEADEAVFILTEL